MHRFLPALLLSFWFVILAGCEPRTEPEPPALPETGADAVAESEPGVSALPPVPVGGFDTDRFREDLKTLSSDEFEGRAPGTRGERLTVNYLVDALHKAGIGPGYGDSYLQPVAMVEITNEARSPLTLEFAEQTVELSYPEQMITWSRELTTDPIGIEGSELVFVGYGIVAPEYDWNDYAGLDVEGRTVVILVNDPGFDDPQSGLFGGRAMTYYGRWTYKFEEAARQGAAGALIVHETEPASYPWEVVINSWSGAQFELGEFGDEPLVTVEGWITDEIAREVFRYAELDFDEQRVRAGQQGFRPVSLGAAVTANVRHSIREGISYNVIGKVEGSARPDETVVYMAHWDHLGRNLAIPGSAGIYNGAIDNASGTASLLEIARLYAAAPPPQRSVVFLAVTLEEYGLLGSRHYVNNPTFEHRNIAGAINMDAINYMGGPTEDMVVVGHGSSELEQYLDQVLEAGGRYSVPEPTPEAGFYYRSDHFNFARAGIPALYARAGEEHVEQGREYMQEIARDYRDRRYHKPADEFDPDWDFRGVAEDMEVLYRVGRMVADSDDWPSWYEGNEFRGMREAQGR